MVDGNDRGAWVVADVSGAFSATVQLVAACTDARPCVLTGSCVYAIDYPPRGTAVAYNLLKLSGTPPFYVMYADSTTYVEIDAPIAAGFTPAGPIAHFTDRSGAPGVLDCSQEYVVSSGCSGCRQASAACYSCGVLRSAQCQSYSDPSCIEPCCTTIWTCKIYYEPVYYSERAAEIKSTPYCGPYNRGGDRWYARIYEPVTTCY
jgi:hypothetical protein